ncbi:hypothetical protein ACWDR0_23840 [Streptomyces sp. NPDC003691]
MSSALTGDEPPIEPTRVVLSGERGDAAGTPPPSSSTPPPADLPAAPPPPDGGAPGLPEPRDWWSRGGGSVATAPTAAPVYVTAPPVTYVTHNHFYPAVQTGGPARFSVARLRPVWNGSAAVAGLLLVPVTGQLDPDAFGAVYAAAAVAVVGELGARMKHRRSGWLVRALSWHVVLISFLTPAGIHALSYLFTGV